MNYNEVLAAARECVGPYCKACPVCNGRACANTMPGPGCKFPGNAAARNYDKWQEICVNMDTLCPNFADPDVSFEMFGHTFSAPIFAAPLGALDISFYRDDFATHLSPEVHSTDIRFDIDGLTVVLVDDVLFTGRTIRAALDALSDFGRPSCVQLAVLVDRGHRELPIRADFVGKNVPSSSHENVRLFLEEVDGVSAVEVLEMAPGDRAGSAPLGFDQPQEKEA